MSNSFCSPILQMMNDGKRNSDPQTSSQVICFWKILRARCLLLRNFVDSSRNTNLVLEKMGLAAIDLGSNFGFVSSYLDVLGHIPGNLNFLSFEVGIIYLINMGKKKEIYLFILLCT